MSKEITLRLPLNRKWYEMTDSGEKTEDYRELTTYWLSRIVNIYAPKESPNDGQWDYENMIYDLTINQSSLNEVLNAYWAKLKPFTTNTLLLGYPKKSAIRRIQKREHKGIEVRTGKPEWGAEEGKLYFVIKHGEQITS